jgi:ribosomal protein L11 methyltransferase
MTMHSVALITSLKDKDRLVAELWELGTHGISERDLPDGRLELRSFFPERIEDPALDGGAWQEEPETDWNERWREAWRPLVVGDRFFLAPEWCNDPTPAGRLKLTMHAGMAFGTGIDATTQLCLEAMERHVSSGSTVLDLGTGTGILAIAASLLGARRVVACDIEAASVAEAASHARLAGACIELFAGSARSLGAASFDVVVANVNAATLVSLAREIRRLGRKAILSGFGAAGLPAIEAAFSPAVETRERGEWVCVVVRAPIDIESPHETTDVLR